MWDYSLSNWTICKFFQFNMIVNLITLGFGLRWACLTITTTFQ